MRVSVKSPEEEADPILILIWAFLYFPHPPYKTRHCATATTEATNRRFCNCSRFPLNITQIPTSSPSSISSIRTNQSPISRLWRVIYGGSTPIMSTPNGKERFSGIWSIPTGDLNPLRLWFPFILLLFTLGSSALPLLSNFTR